MKERSFGAQTAPQDDMVRDDGGVCALRMTIAINSGDDEHRENEEGCFGAKTTASVCTTCPGRGDRHLWFRARSTGRAAWRYG